MPDLRALAAGKCSDGPQRRDVVSGGDDADRAVGMPGVHPVVVTVAVLALDRLSSQTRDAGRDNEDGNRPEGRRDRDRDQQRDGSGARPTRKRGARGQVLNAARSPA